MPHKWFLKLLTALVWGLAAASAVYWGLRVAQTAAAAPLPPAEPQRLASADAGAVARLLGHTTTADAAQAPAAMANRLALIGVIAEGRQGVALLSVDGKPARPYRVGSQVDEALMLQSVGPRHVELLVRESKVVQRLQMPEVAVEALPAGLTLSAGPARP